MGERMDPSPRPMARLFGASLRYHVVAFVVFFLLFLGFVAFAISHFATGTASPLVWITGGLLLLSSGLSAAWEGRAVMLMRRGRTDPPRRG